MVVKTIKFGELPNELDKIIRNMIKEAGKTQAKTTRQAGEFMRKTAISFAPSHSTETEQGIYGQKSGKNYMVISETSSGFPQNVFADGRIMGWAFNKGMVRYPQVHVTGIKPNGKGQGFFTQAENLTKDYFSGIVLKDISLWEIIK